MTNHTASPSTSPSDELPATVREFFTAHVVHDADTASQYLADDVIAIDQGQTWRGRDEVYLFVRDAGAEFAVTTEELGTRRIDDTLFVIGVRLTGNFAGGVAEIDYRFTLRDGLITEIVVGEHEA